MVNLFEVMFSLMKCEFHDYISRMSLSSVNVQNVIFDIHIFKVYAYILIQ